MTIIRPRDFTADRAWGALPLAEIVTVLEVGDIFVASVGVEHAASPLGVARVLAVEAAGSI